MHNYFDFDRAYYEKRYGLFYLSLVSKATGEIIEIPMANEQFDILLEEMEEETKFREEQLKLTKERKWWFL
jgi:hypothetical protein